MKNKLLKGAVLLMSVILMVVTLASCGSEEIKTAGDTVKFTDALGRNVTVEKEPERVAALLGSFADVWLLAGGDVCAAPEDAWDDFGLELPDAISVGGAHSPNTEQLLASDPDFVIASASTASNVQMLELLENAGITVAYFDVDNFEDYLSMLDICTDITGNKELYEKNGSSIKKEIDGIREACRNGALTDEERTVLLLRASSGSVKAKGSEGTILGEMLADLGCINIADSDTSLLETLSVESVIRQSPYRIFVVTMGDDTDGAVDNLNRLMDENPAWGGLEAVREDRLHIMDRRLFNIKPNAKWDRSYEILRDVLLEGE